MNLSFKKFKIFEVTIVSLLLVVIHSCTKDPIDYAKQVETAETKLCLSGFVSDDSIYVVLAKNLPRSFQFQGNDPFQIPDTTAVIEVYEDDNFFCRLKPQAKVVDKGYKNEHVRFYYTSHKKTSEGKKYSIKASHNDFQSVSASAVLPNKVPIVSIDTFSFLKHIVFKDEYDFNSGNYISGDTSILFTTFTVYIQDPKDVKNYYRMNVIRRMNNWGSEQALEDPIIELKAPVYLFTDKLIQGKKYGFKFSINSKYADSLEFRLFTINEDYYKYCVSLGKEDETNEDRYREPLQIYSNVKNGYGIIGGYTSSKIEYYRKK